MSSCVTEVAVGLLLCEDSCKADEVTAQSDWREQYPCNRFLLTRRPEGKALSGHWEFPGGKFERGETPMHALKRELHEELGIEIVTAYPWLVRVHKYAHATVRLNFFRVTAWKGRPFGRENQQLSWQTPASLTVSPVLAANVPILRALQLPPLYAISNATELGSERFMECLQYALENGLRLVQVRENGLSRELMRALSLRVVKLAHSYGARVLINSDIELVHESGADGVHLNSVQLAACRVRPELPWCAASCHNQDEIKRANELGLDFVVLSPVLHTETHPNAANLGWQAFAKMTENSAIPVYALGGLRYDDMEVAWSHGAHGLSMLRQSWQAPFLV